MTTKYTGTDRDRRYVGEQIDVLYNIRRCIHAEACIHNLPTVFDRDGRPWIHADGDSAERTAEVVLMCPSGALHFERKDGGAPEAAPTHNTIITWEDGPLQVHGALEINGMTIEAQETRVTLCRCGESGSKPFCDNSHSKSGFKAGDRPGEAAGDRADQPDGPLTISVVQNGPYVLKGKMLIRNKAGETLYNGERIALCRCGYSSNKPFCDSTHNQIHFTAE